MKKRTDDRFGRSALKAVVIIWFPVYEALVEGLVCFFAGHCCLHSWILQHSPHPLLQLRCVLQAAAKTVTFVN